MIFFLLPGFSMTDCMIDDTFGSHLLLEDFDDFLSGKWLDLFFFLSPSSLRCTCLVPWCSDCVWCREWYEVMVQRSTSLDISFILIFWLLHYLITGSVFFFFCRVYICQLQLCAPLRICVYIVAAKTNVAKLEWTNAAVWPWLAYLLQWDSLNIYLSLLMILQASVPLMVLMETQGFAATGWWELQN